MQKGFTELILSVMKFKVNRDHLLSGLGQVVDIVGSNIAHPAINNVLVETGDNCIALTTFSSDLRISCKVKAEVSTEGKVSLPAKLLRDMVGGFRSLDVFFDVQGENRTKINAGNSKLNAAGLSAADFPKEAVFSTDFTFEMDKSAISKMIRSVSYAQSTDENRYVLNGVFFSFAENELTVVATDGRRLATSSCKLEKSIDTAKHFILPSRTIAELQKLLEGDGKVSLTLGERQVAFEIDNVSEEKGLVDKIKIISKLVEGNYPQYKGVIPKELGNYIEMDKEEMLSAVTQAKKVSDDSIILNISENLIDVTATSVSGDSSDKVAVKYSGPEVRIAFKPSFIVDPLKALVQDVVVLEFKDDLSPGVFKAKDGSSLCVVMPQRK